MGCLILNSSERAMVASMAAALDLIISSCIVSHSDHSNTAILFVAGPDGHACSNREALHQLHPWDTMQQPGGFVVSSFHDEECHWILLSRGWTPDPADQV